MRLWTRARATPSPLRATLSLTIAAIRASTPSLALPLALASTPSLALPLALTSIPSLAATTTRSPSTTLAPSSTPAPLAPSLPRSSPLTSPSPPLALARYGFDGRGEGFDPVPRYEGDEQYSDDDMFSHPPGMFTTRGEREGPRRAPGRATPEQRGDAQGGGYSGGGDGGDDKGRSVWTHAEDTIILEGVAQVGRPQHRPAPPRTAPHRTAPHLWHSWRSSQCWRHQSLPGRPRLL